MSRISLFHELNKFNNTGALMLEYIYHMKLKQLLNHLQKKCMQYYSKTFLKWLLKKETKCFSRLIITQ